MRLAGENRAIVRRGIEALRTTRKPGLCALMRVARVHSETVSARTIGFTLGPRLNAAGRMDDARLALDLLMTRDRSEADAFAQSLEDANLQRQQEQNRITLDASAQVDAMDLGQTGCLVLASPSWHSGIIGIVANKLVERYQRPTVLISLDEETGLGHGSARSIRPFDMFRAVSACADLLEEFGGHSHAAGISIRRENIGPFTERMCGLASTWLRPEDFVPCVQVDAEIDPSSITEELVRSLDQFEPYGRGNEEPVLISRGMEVLDARRIGKERNHLKLRVASDGMAPLDAVMWGEGDQEEHIEAGVRYDLCYRPSLNCFNGRTSVQFVLDDLRRSRA
jgi:single-stranded-DNA-specific exonuclease